MELKQIEYILKIYEEKNITRAAEKLFITQSALNQQLLKLENDIGTQLFYRNRTEIVPTKAGEIYVEYGKKILSLKKEAYNKIGDITEMEKNNISIGFTPGRGINMFSDVFPKFHKIHEEIHVVPMELSVKEQNERIHSGDLDIGFVTFGEKYNINCGYTHIMNEDIMLAVPNNEKFKGIENFSEVDIFDFKEEDFVLMYKNSTMRELVDKVFTKANFKPKELFETSNSNTIITMIKAGICCGVLPYYYIKNNLDSIKCFYIKGRPFWKIGVIYRKGSYITKAAKDFISLVEDYYGKENGGQSN